MSWPYTARTNHRATIYIQTGLQTLHIAHPEHYEEQLRSSSNLPKWIECIYLFKWRVHVPKFRNIFLIWPPENKWKCSRSNIDAILFHKMASVKYKSKCQKWVPSHHTNGSWGKRKKSWLSALNILQIVPCLGNSPRKTASCFPGLAHTEADLMEHKLPH